MMEAHDPVRALASTARANVHAHEPAAPAGLVLVYKASIQGAKGVVLIDTGASYSFVHAGWAQHAGLKQQSLHAPVSVLTANSQPITITTQATGELHLGGARTKVQLKPVFFMRRALLRLAAQGW